MTIKGTLCVKKYSPISWNYFSTDKVLIRNIFSETLCKQLSAVYSSSNNIPRDVTLLTVVDQQQFHVHKFVLQLRSPVFVAMFTQGHFVEGASTTTNQQTHNSGNPVIKIEDSSGLVIEAFVKFLYGQPCSHWKSIAKELIYVAEKVS